jgi:hypothetical protein
MSRTLTIDLFAEDTGHAELLHPLLERLAREQETDASIRVRSARGGHGRALGEMKLYQQTVLKGVGSITIPDLLVVAIDANCNSFVDARKAVQDGLLPPFRDRAVLACPDPHVERWYLADGVAFQTVVGITPPSVSNVKCKRDFYKAMLAQAVAEAGHPALLGGIEFGRELAEAMDYFRAGKADNSLKHFLDEATARFKTA